MNTIIEKIRAEIERRKNNAETLRERNICIDILSFLDTLEKEEKPTIQEQPVSEGLGNEIDRFRETEEYLLAEKAGETDVVIARHFAKWGAENLKK